MRETIGVCTADCRLHHIGNSNRMQINLTILLFYYIICDWWFASESDSNQLNDLEKGTIFISNTETFRNRHKYWTYVINRIEIYNGEQKKTQMAQFWEKPQSLPHLINQNDGEWKHNGTVWMPNLHSIKLWFNKKKCISRTVAVREIYSFCSKTWFQINIMTKNGYP